MYLIDANAIITPFHTAQCGSLSLVLEHKCLKDTQAWLECWYEYGFSTENLVTINEVYKEVVNNTKKDRIEYNLLKGLKERDKIKFLEVTEAISDKFYNVLADIDIFVRQNYEQHQADIFLKKTDPLLIAFAKAYEIPLIVEERHFIPHRDGASGLIKGEPRIPFVAAKFGIECVSVMTAMLVKHSEWGQAIVDEVA